MPRFVSCMVVLILCAPVMGAGRAGGKRPSPAHLPVEDVNFAHQFRFVATTISAQYVRPVAETGLILAGLEGLYAAARQTLPSGVKADVHRAGLEAAMGSFLDLSATGIATGDLARFVADQKLTRLIAEVRHGLGDAEDLRDGNALVVSVQAMTRLLDPYSVVVPGEDQPPGYGTEPAFGLGLEVEAENPAEPWQVKKVLPGGPAQKAGLRPGDRITRLDGQSTEGRLPPPLFGRHPGLLSQGVEKVGAVRVTYRRPAKERELDAELTPQAFRPETVLGVRRRDDNSWDYWADRSRKIAQVRIAQLAEGTTVELRKVLAELEDDGLRGLVLDLRWCPGGILTEAKGVARQFLSSGIIARLEYQDPTFNEEIPAGSVTDGHTYPIVVLVNGDTSGGAELIAAALQDNHRADVAGQRTRGKGSIQRVVTLPVPGYSLKLTTGAFVRPSGKNLHRFPDSRRTDDWGVQPDAGWEYRVSPDFSRQLQLQWETQTLRPGPSNEALPLDDPEADPQRQSALQKLNSHG